MEELLIAVPATCLPYNAGSLASVGCVSVTVRSTFGEELPGDVACAKVSPAFLGRLSESCGGGEVVVLFDSAGGAA